MYSRLYIKTVKKYVIIAGIAHLLFVHNKVYYSIGNFYFNV